MSVNLCYSSPSPPLLLPSVQERELYQTPAMARELLCSVTQQCGHMVAFGLKNPVFQTLSKKALLCILEKINQLLHLLLFMNNNGKLWRRRVLNPLSCWESDQVLVFPKPPLCSLASAGVFRWVCFTLSLPWRPIYTSREVQEGPSSKDDYYFMRTSLFWFACMSCVPRLAGMVPREDLALRKY